MYVGLNRLQSGQHKQYMKDPFRGALPDRPCQTQCSTALPTHADAPSSLGPQWIKDAHQSGAEDSRALCR
jgi:hypothetical protein